MKNGRISGAAVGAKAACVSKADLFIVGVVKNGRISGAAVAAEAAEDVESGGKETTHVQGHHGGEEDQHGEQVEGQQQRGLQRKQMIRFLLETLI